MYKRQVDIGVKAFLPGSQIDLHPVRDLDGLVGKTFPLKICLLYTSDAADERSSVDLGGRRIIKKNKTKDEGHGRI